jgi:hypothetical protein
MMIENISRWKAVTAHTEIFKSKNAMFFSTQCIFVFLFVHIVDKGYFPKETQIELSGGKRLCSLRYRNLIEFKCGVFRL